MEEAEQDDFPNPGDKRFLGHGFTLRRVYICKVFSSTFNLTAWCHKEFFSRAEGLPSATCCSAGWQEEKGKRVCKASVLTEHFMP